MYTKEKIKGNLSLFAISIGMIVTVMLIGICTHLSAEDSYTICCDYESSTNRFQISRNKSTLQKTRKQE